MNSMCGRYPDETIITRREICKMYNLAISVIDYHRVKLMVKSFINKYKANQFFYNLPFHVRNIFQKAVKNIIKYSCGKIYLNSNMYQKICFFGLFM